MRLGITAFVLTTGLALSPATLLATPINISFSGTTTWTEVNNGSTTSADSFDFTFTATAVGGLNVKIYAIDFTIGNGTAHSSLFWDVASGGGGTGNRGAFTVSGASPTIVTSPPDAPSGGTTLTSGQRSGRVTFTGWTTGVAFHFFGDIDREGTNSSTGSTTKIGRASCRERVYVLV